MKIEIEDSGATKVTLDKAGAKTSKYVDLTQLIGLLSRYTKQDLGMLPPNTRFLASRGNNIYIGIEVPAHRRDITYMRKIDADSLKPIVYNNVGFPHAMFFFVLSKERGLMTVRQAYLFGLARPLLSVKEHLYIYPSPNIYTDHRICWGDYDHQPERFTISKLEELEGWVHTFFNSNYNYDLWALTRLADECPWKEIRGASGGSGTVAEDLRKLFKFLSNKDFSNSWLRATEYTIESFTKNLLNQ